MALCGVMTALMTVILCMGSLIPAATFCCPVLASFVLVILLREAGGKYALLAFLAAALLSLLLAPDKEIAFLFLAVGYYPVLKRKLDALPRAAGWVLKLAWFTLSILAVYGLMLFVLRLDALSEEFRDMQKWLPAALLIGGEVVFVLYDLVLNKLTRSYERRRKK